MWKSALVRSTRAPIKTSVSISQLGLIQRSSIRFNSSNTVAAASVVTPSTTEIKTQLSSFADDAVNATVDAIASVSPDKIGYFESIGLAQSWTWPSHLVQHALEYVHIYTGLPWWGAIILTTIGFRVAMFPLFCKSSDMMARLSKIKVENEAILQEMRSSSNVAEQQRSLLKRKKLYKENGIKSRYTIIPILQIPLAIGFFNGIRGLSNYPVDGFVDGGILWFQNLAAPDSYLGLQVISAGAYMLYTKMGGETGAQNFSPVVKKVMTYMPLVSIPLTMSLSSGVILYFATNAVLSITQSTLLKSKAFRNALNLSEIVPPPPPPPGQTDSIVDAWKNWMEKTRKETEKKMQQANEVGELDQGIKTQTSGERFARVRQVPVTDRKQSQAPVQSIKRVRHNKK